MAPFLFSNFYRAKIQHDRTKTKFYKKKTKIFIKRTKSAN